jgi:hypothetical protein
LLKNAIRQYTASAFLAPRFPEFLINRVRSALTKASQARPCAAFVPQTQPEDEVLMLQLVTLGTIVSWALMVVLFLLAYAPQRTMTEIIRDVESSR